MEDAGAMKHPYAGLRATLEVFCFLVASILQQMLQSIIFVTQLIV